RMARSVPWPISGRRRKKPPTMTGYSGEVPTPRSNVRAPCTPSFDFVDEGTGAVRSAGDCFHAIAPPPAKAQADASPRALVVKRAVVTVHARATNTRKECTDAG